MVMVPVLVPVPMFVAEEPDVLMFVPPVAATPPANSTLPVVVPAICAKPLFPASSVRLVAPPVVIAPVPAKPKEVADTAMVSIEATPVSAPPVVTLRPVDETWNVPVALPKVRGDPAPDAKVVVPVEERSVNAPVPGVAAPIDAKLAAPAPVTFHWASLRERSDPEG